MAPPQQQQHQSCRTIQHRTHSTRQRRLYPPPSPPSPPQTGLVVRRYNNVAAILLLLFVVSHNCDSNGGGGGSNHHHHRHRHRHGIIVTHNSDTTTMLPTTTMMMMMMVMAFPTTVMQQRLQNRIIPTKSSSSLSSLVLKLSSVSLPQQPPPKFVSFSHHRNHRHHHRSSRSFMRLGSTTTTSTTTETIMSTSSDTTSSISSSSSSNRNNQNNYDDDSIQYADAIVCGGGPTGLLSAIMLAQQQRQVQLEEVEEVNTTTATNTTPKQQKPQPRFPHIHVYDRLSVPPDSTDATIWDTNIDKFYLIGLGGRGQLALQYFQLWYELVQSHCISVVGRCDYEESTTASSNETEMSNGGGVVTIKPIRNNITTQVLPREKLVSILHHYIQQVHADQITIHYNVEVQPIDFQYQYQHSKNSTATSNRDDDDNGNENDTIHSETTALIRIAKCTPSSTSISTTTSTTTTTAAAAANSIDDDTTTSNTPLIQQPEGVLYCDTDVQYMATPLLIAADGTVRTIANTIASLDQERIQQIPRYNIIQRFRQQRQAMFVQRYRDDNQRVYKTIPLKLPPNWRHDLNYSVRTKRFNLEALPANDRGDYCGVLLLRATDPLAKANTNPNELRNLFDTTMPQFSRLIDSTTMASVAQKPVSLLPTFRYVGPRLHEGHCTVLLGDCAHTVKPYFGLGANSALEDVKLLSEYLTHHPTSTSQAIHAFSKHRTPESKTLVRISRDLDRPISAGGWRTFLLPIILDSIFHRFFPNIFMPNVITMLQRENYTFQQLARRKRYDRIGQLVLIGTVLSVITYLTNQFVQSIAKFAQLRPMKVWTILVLSSVVLSRLMKKLQMNKS